MDCAQRDVVLIVEDDPRIAHLQRRSLERAGYVVLTASSIAEARAAMSQKISLIVLDYRLPGETAGLDFCAELKREGCDVPVIMVTGYSDDSMVIRALRTGVRDFVAKSTEYLEYLPVAVDRILQQVHTQRRLAESEARLAAILETARDAIITVEADLKITYFNRTAERMFLCSQQEALGQSIHRFVPLHHLLPAGAVIAGNLQGDVTRDGRVLRDGRASREDRELREDRATALAEFLVLGVQELERGVRTDGTEFPLEATVSPAQVDGRTFYTITVRDLSEKRQAQEVLSCRDEQLRQSQKMEAIGRLAGGVAHEFNNLLQIIEGYGSYMAENLSPADPNYENVQEILKASARATTLTRQLLTFGRCRVMQREIVDIRQLISDLLKMLRPLLGQHLEVEECFAPCLGQIDADATMIQQAIMNLCLNARDAMPRGGRLRIDAVRVELDAGFARGHRQIQPGPHVRIRVSDTGSGIAAEHLPHLFEPFFTTKPVGGGTGLGLATVLGVVEEHAGAIEVESALDRGSTFTLYLPTTERATVTPAMRHMVEPGGAETILLADDEPGIREFGMRVLSQAGYKVLLAENGVQAVELFTAHAADVSLLLLDMEMPRLLGRRAWEQIVALRADVPAVFMSGYDTQSPQLAFIREQNLEVLQKPIHKGELLSLVRRQLDLADRTRQRPTSG